MRIAVDTGGTFTDCVFISDGELNVLKVFSTPSSPAQAILGALDEIRPGNAPEVRHGTTVGTNTLLERKGARVAFVTTDGFQDSIAIGRQARQKLYDWLHTPDPPLVAPEMRFGVQERVGCDGQVTAQLQDAAVAELVEAITASRPEAVAVSLLFAFANPKHEKKLAAALARCGAPLSVSHEILPEFREYERGSTVLVNAYLAPKMGQYITHLQNELRNKKAGARLHVMQSSGGIVSADVAAREPVRTVLSGPAGGVVGAYALAQLAGFERIISFDMGGTSTDVALIDGTAGGLSTTNESMISGLPIGVPVLDIHTVGAGGGSLARFDAGGALQVGPQSAGADPGPICYGRGTEPTVTDANVVLGRLDPAAFLGGKIRLEDDRARQMMETRKGSVATVEEFASGIVRVAENSMEKAIRVISVERGYDPRDFALVSFGGAGPLHACALARALRIPHVLVPRMPGALSALGILMSDVVKDYSRTVMLAPDDERLETHFAELERLARKAADEEGMRCTAKRSADLRYVGQGYELNVPWNRKSVSAFHANHRRRYGYADASRPLEVVSVRVRMVGASPKVPLAKFRTRTGDGKQAIVKHGPVFFNGRAVRTPFIDREALRPGDRFSGPAIVTEYSATTVIPPRCTAAVDAYKNLVIEVE